MEDILNYTNFLFEEAFINASSNNCIDTIKLLVESKPKCLIVNYNKLLCKICYQNKIDIIKYLIINIRDIDLSYSNYYAFRIACSSGHLDLVKYFLEVKPNINISMSHNIAICSACERGHIEIVNFLLEKIKKNNILYENLLNSACMSGILDISKYIYELNDSSSYNFEHIFSNTCMRGNLNIVKWLLEIKPDIDITSNNCLAFTYACEFGKLNVVKFLLEIKPNIYTLYNNDFINTIFLIVCNNGHTNVAKYLLELKTDIDFIQNSNILLSACCNGCIETVEYLLSLTDEYNFIKILEDENIIDGNIYNIVLNAYLNKINRGWLNIILENEKSHDNSVECPICTDTPNFYIKTPCDHKFCEFCIKTWFINNMTCPYCRKLI